MSIDLHVHSNFSDGTFTPYDLVKLACKKKLKAISITDHDTMDGTEEAIRAGEKLGMEVISGIEMSVVHNGISLHILGYCLAHDNDDLNKKLSLVQNGRENRNIKIMQKLVDQGIPVTHEKVQAISKRGQTGRPHIAQVMVDLGVVYSINEAFDKYLAKGESAYVPRFAYNAQESIDMIHGAGGLAVLAHPVQVDNSLATIPKILEELVGFGLDGIEVYYPSHSKKNKKKLREFAQKYGLFMTGGSDYHGDIKPGTSLAGGENVFVAPSLLEIMKKSLLSETLNS